MNERSTKTRHAVTEGYEKIVRSLFDLLEAISKELAAEKSAATDDKEQVAMYILNIGESKPTRK